jgi:hypothetical protein
LICFAVLLAIWIVINSVIALLHPFDPYSGRGDRQSIRCRSSRNDG